MNNPADEKINSLLPLEHGTLLIGTDRGVARWDEGRITRVYDFPSFRRAPVVAMLTEREAEVLTQIAGGNRNRDIADNLFITEETVKEHITHITERLGANDRTQAVAIGVRRGIIQL